jgi:hypothetical protein
MEKVIFNYEESIKIIDMLLSMDQDSKYIALQSIANSDLKNNKALVMLFLKFGNVYINDIEEFPQLNEFKDEYIKYDKLGPLCKYLIKSKNQVAIKVYETKLGDFVLKMLSGFDLPVNKLDINIKVK